MIRKLQHIILLFIIYVVFLGGGILMIRTLQPDLTAINYATLLTIMTIITLGVYLLVRLGIKKGESEQGILLLAGLGGKFLAYLVLILVFWAVGKNLTKDFIIAFFVLYLVLTIFLIAVLNKSLKNTSL